MATVDYINILPRQRSFYHGIKMAASRYKLELVLGLKNIICS